MSTVVSFDKDILPLFTSVDVDHMGALGVLLDDYDYMSAAANAAAVYAQISSGQMPPPWGGGRGPWSDDQITLFRAWIDGGLQP